jgi:hypothetical protein
VKYVPVIGQMTSRYCSMLSSGIHLFMIFISFVLVLSCCNFLLLLHEQKIKALLETVGSSMCPDHSDWVLNSSLDAQSPNYESLVTYFLEAHPTDYATKKLQVSSFYLFLSNNRSFYNCCR